VEEPIPLLLKPTFSGSLNAVLEARKDVKRRGFFGGV
jgi:hypothetical protein